MHAFIFNFASQISNQLLRYLFITFVFIGLFNTSYSQEERIGEKKDIKLIYRSDYSGGLFLHSHGYGANFRYGQNLTARVKRIFSAELLNMKHPKEKKIFNAGQDDARGYYYGKLNSLTLLRASIGRQKIIHAKELKGGVQVSYLYAFGPILGFLKPIYLEIGETGFSSVKIERYDPDEHSQGEIYGRALFTYGLNEISFVPGGHAKFAMNFEYAPDDDLMKALEVGMLLDVYAKEPEIMTTAKNEQFWLTFYVNLQFGKKIL